MPQQNGQIHVTTVIMQIVVNEIKNFVSGNPLATP